ncbi:MAG TPA: RNA 2'-phosphotransferase [Burkholderiaceae bacterium]
MNRKLISTSKFISLVLRHQPERIGLQLDAQGWAEIDELLLLAGKAGKNISRALLEEVVADNDKQRFVISEDGKRIRANQGHSVDIDLALEPAAPPAVLYHGTATRFLQSIRKQGLLHGSRQHVHLSLEHATATHVGQRHGVAAILKIDAARMHADGHPFYVSQNGVWLCGHVPVSYIAFPEN